MSSLRNPIIIASLAVVASVSLMLFRGPGTAAPPPLGAGGVEAATPPTHAAGDLAEQPTGGSERTPLGVRDAQPGGAQTRGDGPQERAETPPGDAGGPVLVGRVVSENGQPLSAAVFTYEVVEVSSGLGFGRIGDYEVAGTLHVREHGRFRLGVAAPGPYDALRLGLFRPDGSELRANALLPHRLPPGETDLGDLTFRGTGPLARGRVVDGGGRPIAGAQISAALRKRTIGRADFDTQERIVRRLHRLSARSEPDGSYALHGDAPEGGLRLTALHPDYLPASADCRRGDAAVDLVLAEAAGFAGRVLVDTAIPREEMRLRLAPAVRHARGRDLHPAPDGSFEWTSLEPGPARLEVFVGDWSEPAFALDDLILPAGQRVRDPRVDPLDMRGILTAVQLEIVDGRGTALREARATEIGRPAQQGGRWRADHRGRIRIIGAQPAFDLRLFAPGYGAVDVHDLREDRTVRLAPGRPLEVELELAAELEAGESLTVHLVEYASTEGVTIDSSGVRANGTATLRSSFDGRHRVSLWLLGAKGGALVQGPGTSTMLDVDGDEQVVRLRCDQAALDRARAMHR